MTAASVNLLIGCTGSVATIKLPDLLSKFTESGNFNCKVVLTKAAEHFVRKDDLRPWIMHTDKDEWNSWNDRGDPVLHIELGKWADMLLIAPLDANTLAKVSEGLCDNLLTCVVRAWDLSKPLIICPAMNTRMWTHPITLKQLSELEKWGYHQIPPISKTLICGDEGIGAMAEVNTIVSATTRIIRTRDS